MRLTLFSAAVLTVPFVCRPLSGQNQPTVANPAQTPIFEDVAAASGLDFTHFNGMTGEYHLPEITGSGGAMFDYDGDGDLDLYLVQGALLSPKKTMKDAWYSYKGPGHPRDRLYRNDSNSKGAAPRFTDVTDSSGIDAKGYGMGCIAADIDNDGDIDLYVTNLGPNQLYRNKGDGSFEDITEHSRTGDPGWGTSASFFDYDRDGLLDLYVANYAEFDPENDPRCFAESSARDYCGPDAYKASGDRLYHNLGGGRFEDATRILRGLRAFGAGLGVVSADFNGDTWPDIYVANDGDPNQLWINNGKGGFSDEAMFAGAALNAVGAAEASMGVAAGDFDGDGDEDLFMTHLMGETNTIYVNGGDFFDDRTNETGLGVPSFKYTAFGTDWCDVDNDGWLDLVILNGSVRILEEQSDDRFPLKQPNQLFRNMDGKRFEDISERAGKDFTGFEVSRGAAFGDVDNDGDTDVLVLNNNGPARLLINRVGQSRHWLGLRLVEGSPPRDALGARVKLTPVGGPPRWRRAHTDGSYCSSHDPRVLIGLGDLDKVKEALVIWPDGRRETFADLPVDRYITLEKGSSKVKP